ncbi:MAG: TM2 domain-containing protein [Lentisphaeria bacterium]|nr:TM2 domain-containing protein [Lentisphaeria bacterium]
MNCPNCNNPITPEVSYCPKCGRAFQNPSSENILLQKNRLVYILLGIFLGCWGVHNFYAGYIKRAVIQLLLSVLLCWTFIVPAIVFIWVIIDICTVDRDANGNIMVM